MSYQRLPPRRPVNLGYWGQEYVDDAADVVRGTVKEYVQDPLEDLGDYIGDSFCSLIKVTGLRGWFVEIQQWLQTADVANNFFAYMFRSIFLELFLNLVTECNLGRAFKVTAGTSYKQLDSMQKTTEIAVEISAAATAITAAGGAAAAGVGAVAAVVPAIPLATSSAMLALCGAGKAVLKPIAEDRWPAWEDLKELFNGLSAYQAVGGSSEPLNLPKSVETMIEKGEDASKVAAKYKKVIEDTGAIPAGEVDKIVNKANRDYDYYLKQCKKGPLMQRMVCASVLMKADGKTPPKKKTGLPSFVSQAVDAAAASQAPYPDSYYMNKCKGEGYPPKIIACAAKLKGEDIAAGFKPAAAPHPDSYYMDKCKGKSFWKKAACAALLKQKDIEKATAAAINAATRASIIKRPSTGRSSLKVTGLSTSLFKTAKKTPMAMGVGELVQTMIASGAITVAPRKALSPIPPPPMPPKPKDLNPDLPLGPPVPSFPVVPVLLGASSLGLLLYYFTKKK